MTGGELKLCFLGGLQIWDGRQRDLTADLAKSKKAQAILCYLALNTHTHFRRELAGKFWGDKAENLAHGSLRVAIRNLKEAGLEPYLTITNNTIAFDLTSAYWCDAEAFTRLLARYRWGESAGDVNLLRQAADLYRGEFLDGFTLGDTPEFDDWVVVQREHWRELALTALDDLVDRLLTMAQYAEGITYASRQLTIDPLREPTHRQLMRLLAANGQRSAALEQYEKCREWLLLQLGEEPEEETTAVYEAIKAAPHTSTRPLRSPPVLIPTATGKPPLQAPPLTPHFVGRSQPLAELEAALTASGVPPRWGIVGMGGVGKTTLASHLAHRLYDHFPDGVLWATAVNNDPMHIAETWAAALGYDFAGLGTLAERSAALRAVLAEKKALLVFDDVTLASPIKPLLPESGQCAVLCTSRRADAVRNLDAAPIWLAELSSDNGRRLLSQYISEDRAAADATAVADICDLLQNLPLAIALAGGYLNYRPNRPLATFVAQLRQETSRLSLDHENREVRATLSISWQGLDVTQRHVFRQLGVFNGRTFPPEAAAAIAEMELFPTLDRLDELVRLSLLTPLAAPAAAQPLRYRQHTLLADFAREQLGAENSPARQEANGRLAAYFLAFATDHQRDYTALRPEWENLDAGLTAAYRQHMWPLVLAYTAVLRQAWFTRGRYTQARQAFAQAQEAALALEDEQAIADTWLHWGVACLEQGDFDEAWNWLQKSLDEYRRQANLAQVATAQTYLGRIAANRARDAADLQAAAARLAESMTIRQQLNDQGGVADVLYRQAVVENRMGHPQKALALCLEAQPLYEQVNDTSGLIRLLRFAAFLALELQQMALAAECSQRAFALAQAGDDKGELALAYLAMGRLYWRLEELGKATNMANESLALLQKIGDSHSQATVLYLLSLIYRSQKAYESGLRVASECLQLNTAAGDQFAVGWCTFLVGQFLYGLGRREEALVHWQKALSIASELHHEELAKLADECLTGQSVWRQKVDRESRP